MATKKCRVKCESVLIRESSERLVTLIPNYASPNWADNKFTLAEGTSAIIIRTASSVDAPFFTPGHNYWICIDDGGTG